MKNSAPARARCVVTGRRPDVFAHRHADRDAAKIDRVGHRPRREHPLFVEDPVVRQIELEPPCRRAFVDDDGGVVDASVFAPRRGGDERRRVVALAHETIDRGVARIDDRWPQHEIFGRISDERELGQHDEIGAARGRSIARAPDAREVAVDVAYGEIELCERDGEHGRLVGGWWLVVAW